MAASAHEFEAKMNDGSMRAMTEYKEWFQKFYFSLKWAERTLVIWSPD